MTKIRKFLREYLVEISVISGIFSLLTLLGFQINVFDYYKIFASLNTEIQILLVGTINILFTLLIAQLILKRMENSMENIQKKAKIKSTEAKKEEPGT